MSEWLDYAPILIVVLVFLFKNKLVVTPEQLERKHREIIEEVEAHFATREALKALEKRFDRIEAKIDKIYDKIMGVGL